MVGCVAKTDGPVQRERSVVRFLRVDPAGCDLTSVKPMERIGDQGGAESLALVGRMDRKPLEVALVSGPAGDGVADHGRRSNDTEATDGCGIDRLVQTASIESPERIEGLVVDGEDGVEVSTAPTTKPAGPVRSGPEVGEVVSQKVKRFVLRKAVGGEHIAFRRADGGGHNGIEAVVSKPGTDLGEGGWGQGRGGAQRHQVGEIVSSSPTPGADSSRLGGQCVHPHGSMHDTRFGRGGTLRGCSCC